jgi:hypothetical protein
VLALEKVEVGRVGDRPVLHRLGHARRELRGRERAEHIEVGHHQSGLVERADQVLPGGNVHGGLATDRGVDHREQRRRHLDVGNAAQVGRRHEARHVAHDAAAQRDHGRIAADVRGEHLVGERGPGFARLVAFSRREGKQLGLARGVAARGQDRLPVERGDVRVADHGIVAGRARAAQRRRQLRQQSAADQDIVRGVARLGQRDGDRHHTTSGTPARALARRASTNRRSDKRFR